MAKRLFTLPSLPDTASFGRARAISSFKRDRLSFYEDYLDCGLEMRQYCPLRAEQLEGRGDPAYIILREIAQGLQGKGVKVSQALAPFVPDSDIVLLAAHEAHNSLDKGFDQLIETVREEDELKSQAKRELGMPLFYFIAAIAIITYAVPWIVGTFNGVLLQPATMTLDQRALVALADFMSSMKWVFDVIYIALPTAFALSLNRWGVHSRVPGRRWLDHHFPLYAAYRSYRSALFLRTLGAQMAVTPQLDRALSTIRSNSDNNWLASYLIEMEERLPHYRTRPIMALDVGLLDPKMIDSLFLVSIKGSSEHAIASRAQIAFKQALSTIRAYLGTMRVAGLVLIGVVLGWVVFSLLTQTLRQQVNRLSNPASISQQQ